MAQPKTVKIVKTETIHTILNERKTACIVLILSDTPATANLENNVSLLNRLIITDVIPQKTQPEKATLYFRNYNNKEVLDLTAAGVLSPGSVEMVFNSYLQNHVLTPSGVFIPKEEYEQNKDTYKTPKNISLPPPTKETLMDLLLSISKTMSSSEDNGSFQTGITEAQLVRLLKANLVNIEEQNNPETQFKLTIDTATAHLGGMLHSMTNAPAFLAIPEQEYENLSAKEKLNVDNYTILEFPPPNTTEFYESTAYLNQEITGEYKFSISAESMNKVRGDILNSILLLSSGNQEAVINMFNKINPLKKALKIVKEKATTRTVEKPSTEILDLSFFAEMVERIYDFTSPENIAALVQETKPSNEYLHEIETLKNLFEDSGLNESFTQLLKEHDDDNKEISFLLPPTEEATFEEIISYYSAEIESANFPESMRAVSHYFQMPLLYDYNWAKQEPKNLKVTDDNVSEIIIAKLITVAVRFARLETIIVNKPSFNVNPLACIVRGMSHAEESLYWVHTETIKKLATPETGKEVFMKVFIKGLGTDVIDQFHIGYLMNTSIAFLLHHLGHKLVHDLNYPKNALFAFLDVEHNIPIMKDFLDSIIETGEQIFNEAGEEQSEALMELGICEVAIALQKTLEQLLDPTDMVNFGEQLVAFLIELASLEIGATDSEEHKQLMLENYFVSLLADNSEH